MQFIEALKLKSKLLFLFILITIGLITVGVMGTMKVNAMKKNIDSLYFGSLIPVVELNEILQTYHSGLASTIYKAKGLEISKAQTSEQLDRSLKKIKKVWKNYENHFKRDEEMQYVEYTSVEIIRINNYFVKILQSTRTDIDMRTLSIESLERNVAHIHNVIQKLIKYEVDMAKYERKLFTAQYESAYKKLGMILSLIILAVLIISYSVFRSIQIDHTKLELTTKKLRKANKKLENVSYTDSLTNIHNRRYFNHVYSREMARAKRTHSYVTFMMIDVDFFKQYNDIYGHIKGDEALKSVAQVLKDTLQRPSDFVFRLGGEEFGVVITQTDESNSARLARVLCDAIRAKEIEHKGSKAGPFLTISVGVVCCIADDALNEDIMMSRADEMLYEAKKTGRDRYIITSNASETTTHTMDELITA